MIRFFSMTRRQYSRLFFIPCKKCEHFIIEHLWLIKLHPMCSLWNFHKLRSFYTLRGCFCDSLQPHWTLISCQYQDRDQNVLCILASERRSLRSKIQLKGSNIFKKHVPFFRCCFFKVPGRYMGRICLYNLFSISFCKNFPHLCPNSL